MDVAPGHEVTKRRNWNVVLHKHDDGLLTMRVRVDGQPVLPDCVGEPSTTALAYVDAALVDVLDDDQLTLRAQGSDCIVTHRATSKTVAVRWLKEHIAAASPRATGLIVKDLRRIASRQGVE
jgi:hypothetical protein